MSKRTLAICSAVHTLHDGLSDVTYLLLPLLANAFGLSLAKVGMIRGAHRAAMAAFQIPAGIVRMIVTTELATSGGILIVLALSASGALVLLPLLGVVLQGTSSVLYATIGEYVQPERLSRAFGLFYTVGSVCGIAAPLAYGLLGDRLGVEVAIAALSGTILLTQPLVLSLRSHRLDRARA